MPNPPVAATLVAIGSNLYGQCGLGRSKKTTDRPEPCLVFNNTQTYSAIAAGHRFSLALTSPGLGGARSLLGSGLTSHGELGVNPVIEGATGRGFFSFFS